MDDLEEVLAAAYRSLAESQTPLGREFEVVWDENTDRLYEN